jgi:hypothetical protein
MAERLNCDERRLQRMERGRFQIPDAIADAVDALYDQTRDVVQRFIGKYRAQLEHQNTVTMAVYRSDEEYGDSVKHARFPARWHRQVAARVADALPKVQLDYTIEVEMDLPPWERAKKRCAS